MGASGGARRPPCRPPGRARDPAEYFQRIKQAIPHGWIVVEKILEPGKRSHKIGRWPVRRATISSTDWAASWSIRRARQPISEFYTRFTDVSTDYLAMVHQKKHYVLKSLFGSDINRLTFLLAKVCERQKRYRDYSRRELNVMLREVIACFPVYRS